MPQRRPRGLECRQRHHRCNIGQAVDTNVIADQLRMVAGDFIGNQDLGQVDLNRNAIDTQVGTVAAFAEDGIYIQEEAVGGGLIVGSVLATTIDLTRWKSSLIARRLMCAPRTRWVHSGLTTGPDIDPANGHIKVRVDAGTLTINQAVDADSSGDVLLRAYGPLSDVLVNATVTSDAGDVTVYAADDVVTTAAIATDGNVYIQADDVNVAVGDDRGIVIGQTVTSNLNNVLLSSARDITLNANIAATALNVGVIAGRSVIQNANIVAGQDILVRALGGDVTIAATTSSTAVPVALSSWMLRVISRWVYSMPQLRVRVALNAGSDIIDGNIGQAVDTNIIAGQLRMVAGDFIGNQDLGQVDLNRNAIDTQVGTVAAFAEDGIYIQEEAVGGGLIVGSVLATTIDFNSVEVKFDSTQIDVRATHTLGTLSGLTTDQISIQPTDTSRFV